MANFCSICLNTENGSWVSVLGCNHHFHDDCILQQWATNGTCPNCRVPIDGYVLVPVVAAVPVVPVPVVVPVAPAPVAGPSVQQPVAGPSGSAAAIGPSARPLVSTRQFGPVTRAVARAQALEAARVARMAARDNVRAAARGLGPAGPVIGVGFAPAGNVAASLTCHICGHVFGTTGGKSKHMQSHGPAGPRTCGVCGLVFGTTYALQTHQANQNH